MWFFVQLCSSWHDFNWLKGSHGLSAAAELLLSSVYLTVACHWRLIDCDVLGDWQLQVDSQMKLLQNCWSELLMLNILYLQTCHNRNDVILVVSNGRSRSLLSQYSCLQYNTVKLQYSIGLHSVKSGSFQYVFVQILLQWNSELIIRDLWHQYRDKCRDCHHHHNHTTAVLWPFFRDHPGEPVPEGNFWTLWCKGRLTEADTPTIRLGATPSGLTSAHLHHPPIFYRPDALLPPNQQCQSTEDN